MKPILEFINVSKRFRISQSKGSYLSLREQILNPFKSEKSVKEDFWALDNISFEVEQGQTIGIVGKNGAGKSTLLKILSKITPPTRGKIICRGRVASLLEVGTGFHPELTGRENIYFNGSLLGMKNSEIARNFDEIVEFSGVEKFLDTPLKHYSSGMQLRLAFSVSAFLEPELLVIDEVLAVGDAEFQKKCLGKMEDVSKSGRTILFVSHNIGAIRQLCKKGILLDGGKLTDYADIDTIVDRYQKNIRTDNRFPLKKEINKIRIEEVHFRDLLAPDSKAISFGGPWSITINVNFLNEFDQISIAVGLIDAENRPVRTYWHKPLNFKPGSYDVTFTEDTLIMAEGIYRLVIGFSFTNISYAYFDEGLYFEIIRTERSQTVFENHFFAKTDLSSGIIYNPFLVTVNSNNL